MVDGTGLLAIALAIAGGAGGIVVGWVLGLRRLRIERGEHQEHLEQVRRDDVAANELSHSLRRARMCLDKLEDTVSVLETRIEDRNRRIAKLDAQVIDRESTIDSLRASLYGARISMSLLEDELEQVQRQSTSTTTATDSITISLETGLEIETAPNRSQTGSGE